MYRELFLKGGLLFFLNMYILVELLLEYCYNQIQ